LRDIANDSIDTTGGEPSQTGLRLADRLLHSLLTSQPAADTKTQTIAKVPSPSTTGNNACCDAGSKSLTMTIQDPSTIEMLLTAVVPVDDLGTWSTEDGFGVNAVLGDSQA